MNGIIKEVRAERLAHRSLFSIVVELTNVNFSFIFTLIVFA